jgi:CheY-like chemotaxis protein
VSFDADPVRLTQVLSNLINNACKYSHKNGHIQIVARVQSGATLPKTVGAESPAEAMNFDRSRPRTAETSEVVISVEDKGIGIATEDLSRVFDMFSQVNSASSRSHGGLGIGLSLVRGLVELHGGSVEARSAGLGKGSEFIICLPAAEMALPVQEIRPAASAPKPRSIPGHKRILVVDDNKLHARSLAMLLELKGFDAEIVYDAASALKVAGDFTPDVALIDLGLPDMTGYELARRLRALPQLGGITLIAQTGWGQEEDRRRCLEAGIDHHLIKPVDLGTLEQLLASRTLKVNAGS